MALYIGLNPSKQCVLGVVGVLAHRKTARLVRNTPAPRPLLNPVLHKQRDKSQDHSYA